MSGPPFFRGFSPPERFNHNGDEWVLAVGGEKRHARRGLAARIVAGDSQDSRRERREAARGGATWKGREEQEGKGSQGRNLHWKGTTSGATEMESAVGVGVEWREGGKREGGNEGNDALRGSGVCQLRGSVNSSIPGCLAGCRPLAVALQLLRGSRVQNGGDDESGG